MIFLSRCDFITTPTRAVSLFLLILSGKRTRARSSSSAFSRTRGSPQSIERSFQNLLSSYFQGWMFKILPIRCLEVSKAWIRILVVCVDKYFLMLEMVRGWLKADLQTLLTWRSIDIRVVWKIACEEGLIMSVPKRSRGRDCCGLYFENK